MNLTTIVSVLIIAYGLAGCSAISRPSMPSLPWSKSASQSDPTVEALFEQGTRYFNEKRYARAIDAFGKIKTDHPFSPLVVHAELKMADAYYLNKQYPEAVAAFKEFQSLHPTNENIPFVLYRLGQAHFDQFTAADRDQKNTGIAKGYFESLIANHPKSPYAIEAREKLAKTVEYLAEADFKVAHFYFQQEKYPAARDRFEEIVRKYRDTPTAIKSLFFLGESYRKEKNGVKAALAYEALVQHYPKSKFATEAKTQLAQLEKEKHDPLAMLLMRDRPGSSTGTAPETGPDPALAKLRDVNLIQKKEVVYEEPGQEKGIFRRVVDKINPFSSSDNGKKEEKKPETAVELLAKKKAAEKEKSGGLLAWLNPFSGKKSEEKQLSADNSKLVGQIDDSLQQKGIALSGQQAALKPPPEGLPQVEETPPMTPTDTGRLIGQIDSNLKKDRRNVGDLPPAPQAAGVFRETAAGAAVAAKTATKPQSSESPATSGLLSSIDQKLKAQGVEPSRVATPTPVIETKEAPQSDEPKKVQLEPKLAVEKGQLFLSPPELQTQEKADAAPAEDNREKVSENQEAVPREIPKSVLRGPSQSQPPIQSAKPVEAKKTTPGQEEEPKGALEQLREDAERVGRILNPFSW
jgi:outer membrane protein assembly factor BamD